MTLLRSTRGLAALLFTALLALVGCDSLDSDTPLATADAAQVDYSLVGEEAQDALWSVSAGTSAAESLARFGFQLEGAVFTLSDDTVANEVLAFERARDGRLSAAGTYPTGGAGSGDGLNGTSNPMALALGNRYLYAVNGGSDEVSAFAVDGARLTLLGTVGAGGLRPISVTVHDRLVYVVNVGRDGTPGNIAGFTIQDDGTLAPLDGSVQPLTDGAASPSQIDFTPRGDYLVVTDKPTNTIMTYAVNVDGTAGPLQTSPGNGETTFGFDFDFRGRLIVSEAFGGAPDASAVSSYRLRQGTPTTLSESVPTTETAACWVETFGPYAYASNTGSGSITGYFVRPDGTLVRLDDDGVTVSTGEGSQPLDMDIALFYLYVQSAGTDRLSVYRIGLDGSLTSVSGAAINGLPPTARGVLAY